MRAAALVTVALGATAPAWACPTAADLDTGIRFTVEGGASEVFRRVQPQVLEAVFRFADGGAVHNLLAKGVYLLEYVDLEDGEPVPDSRATYRFPMTPGAMPDPVPEDEWQVSAVRLEAGQVATERQVYRFGARDSVRIGDCGYAMVPIAVTFPDDPDGLSDILHYLPDLGLAYLARLEGGGAPPEIYTYTGIEVLE